MRRCLRDVASCSKMTAPSFSSEIWLKIRTRKALGSLPGDLVSVDRPVKEEKEDSRLCQLVEPLC